MKVQGQSSLVAMTDAEGNRVRVQKRKNENMDSEDERENRRTLVNVQINLKRKREHDHDELIDLGLAIHGTSNPHVFSTALDRRINLGGSPMG